MFLNHVTFNLMHNGLLTPRVPENAEDYEENTSIPRICFASTLEGCLSSMPQGGWNLDESLEDTNGIIKVFRINPKKYGVKLENIVLPEVLAAKGYVIDAWATGEHWVLQPLIILPEDTYYARVCSYTMKCLGRDGFKDPSQYKTGDIDVVTNLVTQVV